MAGDISQTLADMVARSKIQPNQNVAHPTVIPPGPQGGFGTRNEKRTAIGVQANVTKLAEIFGFGPEADKRQDDLVKQFFTMYTEQGASQDPAVQDQRERDLDNPVLQTILAKAAKRGNPFVRVEEIIDDDARPATPDIVDPASMASPDEPMGVTMAADGSIPEPGAPRTIKGNPLVTKTRYSFKQLAPSAQAQSEEALRVLPPELRGPASIKASEDQILGGGTGMKPRQLLMDAKARIAATHARAGVVKEDPRIKMMEQANKQFADYVQHTYAAKTDILDPKDEKSNFDPLVKLGSVVKNHIQASKLYSQPEEGRRSYSVFEENVSREMDRPDIIPGDNKEGAISQAQRRATLAGINLRLLKTLRPTEAEAYTKAMSWVRKTHSGPETVALFKNVLGFDDSLVNDIYYKTPEGLQDPTRAAWEAQRARMPVKKKRGR